MSSDANLQPMLLARQELIIKMLQVGEQVSTVCATESVTWEQILPLLNARTEVYFQLQEITPPDQRTIHQVIEEHDDIHIRELAKRVQSQLEQLLIQNTLLEQQMGVIRDVLGENIVHVQYAMNLEGKYHPKRPPSHRGALLDEKG